jgi:hypothetical protein
MKTFLVIVLGTLMALWMVVIGLLTTAVGLLLRFLNVAWTAAAGTFGVYYTLKFLGVL